MTEQSRTKKIILICSAACLILCAVVLLCFFSGSTPDIKVKITEICSANSTVIADENGCYSDYVEFFNAGESFMLTEFGLSNERNNSVCYVFGEIEFKSGEYLVVFCDGNNVPFRLSSDGGEYIGLIDPNGRCVASVSTVATEKDEVMLLSDRGYVLSSKASPGFPNTEDGVNAFLNRHQSNSGTLIINEIFIANRSTLPDKNGNFGDIIEIKNVSDTKISLLGWYLSDSENDLTKYSFPDIELESGEIALVFASEEYRQGAYMQAAFGISAGEKIILSNGSKRVTVVAEDGPDGYSLSRTEAEDGGIRYEIMPATPGFENDESGREAFLLSLTDENPTLVISEILFSNDLTPFCGKLRDVVEICNVSDKTVSTDGWFISDSIDNPLRFAIPSREIAPGECLLLYCEVSDDEHATGFGLSPDEYVFLTSPEFKHGDYILCNSAGRGCSRSRFVCDGEVFYDDTDMITLGYRNTSDGRDMYAKSVRPEIIELSEAVSINTKYLKLGNGSYCDFVEIHNRTEETVDLTGWYISDNPKKPTKAALDGISLKPGEYKTVILTKEPVSGYYSAGFALSSAGETVVLSYGETIVDYIALPELGENASFGRPNGKDYCALLEKPTPGTKNAQETERDSDIPVVSVAQGVYNGIDSLSVELSGKGKIYYTLDCTEPTSESILYTGPITLESTSVIRAICIEEGKKKSGIADFTYIINENNTLEVVTLVTTPSNLWDYNTGIYATGPGASSEFPYEGANYHKDWERPASVSFFPFEGDGFSQNCGIKIFGGFSRALAKKSIACYFRAKYGKGELDYQLFEDDELSCFESFVLRNTGQDWNKTAMRDAMITSIASDYLGLDVQNHRPVVLYINGEYWGVYYIREKISEHYVAGHYGVRASDVQVCTAGGVTCADYQKIIKYVVSHNLSNEEYYEYVSSMVDIDDYMKYIVAEICIANSDNGNIKFFKAGDGKWRWIMYDVDQAFKFPTNPTVQEHLNPAGTGSSDRFPTTLINALLKNDDFKEAFISELARQMNEVWTPDVVNAYIDIFDTAIGEEMKRDAQRWNHKYSSYTSGLQELRDFISAREKSIYSQVKSYFGLSDNEMSEYGFVR